VVVAALQRQAQDLQTQVQQIQQETERKVPLVPEIVRLKEQDEKALAARSDVLEQELTNLRTRESQMLAAQAEKSAETQSVMQVVVERRNEGFRMKNLLELLRTDAYVAQVQKKALDDELIRLKENVRRLEKRNQQLKQTISTTYDQDKVSSNP
jgi:chromosome segregation ATPase